MVRQQAHQLGRRKRRMQEKPDRLPAIELAQCGAERDQVIVVDPDEIVRPQHRRQGAGEGAVDPQIAGEAAPRIADQRRPVMKQRPQHPVGVADVVFVVIAPRQIERRGGDRPVADQLGRLARPLADRAAEAEPQPAGALQCGADRDREAALARLVMADRTDPVRHDDEPARGGGRRNPGARRRGCAGARLADRRVCLAHLHPLPFLATCG